MSSLMTFKRTEKGLTLFIHPDSIQTTTVSYCMSRTIQVTYFSKYDYPSQTMTV